jgi:osmoprotectant transport system ATP-binding protein
MSDPMIRLEGVSKTFPGTAQPAVGDLSFDVHTGEILTLVGPSGCGKTTTLKMINRIVEPTSGTIVVDGRDVTAVEPYVLRRSIGYVIQQIGLFPHRTIAENVATVPTLLGWEPTRIEGRIRELIETVGLDATMLDRFPSELSGGQQQRVGVARALAADPPVLLMDEPFGAVDPIVRARLQEELLELQRQVHKTIVFVTHDIDEAIHLGDRICILNVGGHLEQIGPPEEILREPAGHFVQDFLGGERGLKRLGLLEIHQANLRRGPMIDVTAGRDEALAAMAREETDWVGVLDGERLLGWIGADMLDRVDRPSDAEPRSFKVRLPLGATLRQALDAVVSSRARMAVVTDGDRYVGMVDVETIASEITE